MQIIKLHDEIAIMRSLKSDSILLIHHTNEINPIKKLTEAYDIIELNLLVQEKFKEHKDSPIWDVPALKELNHIRCELMAFYHLAFYPRTALFRYNDDLISFFKIMQLRTQNDIL